MKKNDMYHLFGLDHVKDADAIRDVTAYQNEVLSYRKAKHDLMVQAIASWTKKWEPTMMKIDDQEVYFQDYAHSTKYTEYGFMVILTPCTEIAHDKLKKYTENPKIQKVQVWFHTGCMCEENVYMGECDLEVEEQDREDGNTQYCFKFYDTP